MSVADEPQRSLLAIGGLLNERNKDDHGLLGGSHRPHGSGRAMTILGRGWSTFTTKDVHDRLEWLVHEGHRGAYAEQQKCSPEAFYGWDFARVANVAGWAYVAYLLDRDEAWAWVKRAAGALKTAYRSYAELGQSYVRGLVLWTEDPNSETVLDAQRALASLLSRDDSPFRLPFLPSIEDVAAPDEPVREVHVAEGASIAAAIEDAGPNGRVVLAAGTFRESLRPKHSVEIVGAGAHATILESSGTPPLYVDPNLAVLARDLKLVADRSPKGDSLTAVFNSAGFVHLERVTVAATHHGLALRKDGDAHVFDCSFDGCGQSGVDAEGNFVVVETTVKGAGLAGITRRGGKLGGVVERATIVDPVESGIVAKADITVRDTTVLRPGKFGVVATTSLDLTRVAVAGSRGSGLVVEGDRAHVHARECTIEGSALANVEVKSGYADFEGCTVKDGHTSGVVLHGAARVLFAGGTIADNAQGNVYALDGARHVIDRCDIHGGTVGLWSRGSVGFVHESFIKGASGACVQLSSEGGPALVRCFIEDGGASGVEVRAPATPRLTGCTIRRAKASGLWLEEGARPAIEVTKSENNGEPDEPANASQTELAPVAERTFAIRESAEGSRITLEDPGALLKVFAARAEAPSLDRALRGVARALGARWDKERASIPLELAVEDGVIVARTDTPEGRAAVREELAHVRDRPEWIVAQVDEEELLAFLEAMRAGSS